MNSAAFWFYPSSPTYYGGHGRQDLTEYTLQTKKRKEFNTKQKKKIGVKNLTVLNHEPEFLSCGHLSADAGSLARE
jgi:hypothetical protein